MERVIRRQSGVATSRVTTQHCCLLRSPQHFRSAWSWAILRDAIYHRETANLSKAPRARLLRHPESMGYLQHLGFKALATTSAGFAFSRGLPDYAVPRDAMLAHIRELVEATDLPVNADYENGYADDPEGVAKNVRLCVETGLAGLSIEDSTGDEKEPLYRFDDAVARIKAARAAIDETGGETILVARTECFLVGLTDINEVTRRLRAFSEAGADCLYAPGLGTRDDIAAVVKAAAPKPVNVLISAPGGITHR